METDLYALRTSSYWLSGIGVRLGYRYAWFTLSTNLTIIPVSIIPGHHGRNSRNVHSPGSSSGHVPISAQAARVGLVLGRVSTELVREISGEEADGAFSMTWLSLEYILLQLSRLPGGSIRTAGPLEVFFDFLVLVGDIRLSWSSSTVSYRCRDHLIYLSNRVDESASRSLTPPLAREMMIVIFLAISDTNIRNSLFGF